MNRVIRAAERLDRTVANAIRYFTIFAVFAIMLLLALGIFVRLVPLFSMAGYDELIELLFAWMTFLGAFALWREGALFKVEILRDLPGVFGRLVHRIVQLSMLLFAAVFTGWGWKFAAGATEYTPFLMLPKSPWFFSMPVAGMLMLLYSLCGLIRSSFSSKQGRG